MSAHEDDESDRTMFISRPRPAAPVPSTDAIVHYLVAIAGVDPGRRHVTVEARGYVPERRGPLEILPGATADLGRIDLLPGTELRVRVRDKAGKAIEHCQVQLRPVAPEKGGAKRGNRAWKLERRGKGLYGLDAVPRGKWRLRVVHPGYRTHSAPVDVREKAAGELVVILEPA